MKKTLKIVVDFIIALLASGLTATVFYPLAPAIGYQTVGLIFLIVIAALSLFLGRSALIFAAILSFAVWNFLFITPLYTFRVHNLHDLIALFAYLAVAIVGSAFISRIRKSQQSLKKIQERLIILNGFLESLNTAISIKDVVKRAQGMMKLHFDADLIIFLKAKESDALSPVPFGCKELFSDLLWKQAVDVFEEKEDPDQPEQTDPDNRFFLFSLEEPREKFGVAGVVITDPKIWDNEKFSMLKSFISQIASALDREISIDMAKKKDIYSESEKLFRTVLNSVSHELKTPIAIISAAVANLSDERTSANSELRSQIILELEQASNRLDHIVENILDMSRIESGVLKLNLYDCDVTDLIGTLINSVKPELHDHTPEIRIQEDLPSIRVDFNLLVQALTNVMRNAISYSPAGSTIRVESSMNEKENVRIRILDQGPGIPVKALPRLFEKFYRVPGTRPGGTGLGLTIAKAIIETHNGKLTIGNRPEGGVVAEFVLPVNIGKPYAKEPL